MSVVNLESEQELYKYLVDCSDAYYNTGSSPITDAEFDNLVSMYEQKYNKQFTYIGTAAPSQTKETLPAFMPSLNKCKDSTSLKRFEKALPASNSYVFSEKLDGISLLLHYTTKGLRLYTRGDGSTGSNVDHLQRYISFPFIAKSHVPILIRGELIIPKQHTDELGQALRNIICGAVMAKTPDATILKCARFVAYGILNQNQSANNVFKTLQSLQFNVPLVATRTNCSIETCNEVLSMFQSKSLYQIDGLVVAKDVFVEQKDSDNPKHVIAFKRAGTRLQTKVVDVQWNQSRYGKFHPVVVIEPVTIDGCVIQCASGFHAAFIRDNFIGSGALIEIERSGDVIPNIVRVIERATQPQLPDNIVWDGVHIKSSKDNISIDADISRLVYSFKTLKAKGISEQTIRKLYQAGFTNEIACWDATAEQLANLDGFQQKSAANVVASLQSSKQNLSVLNALLISACFANYGEKKLVAIMSVIDVVSYLANCNVSNEDVVSRLATVHIRDAMATVFINQCETFRNNKYFMQLLALGLQQDNSKVVSAAPNNTNDVQHNIKVVFSGFRDSDLVTRCQARGITVSSAGVSRSTNVLVLACESSTSSKSNKATELGIPIMTKEEFQRKYLQ